MAARADFSYITTIKSGGPGGGSVTKHKIKGNKMRIDTGDSTTLFDLDAQTTTAINHTAKTYRVTPLAEIGGALSKAGSEIKAEVKETGQKKRIGGFDCRQVMMTMSMAGPAGSMTMENEMWVSADVPNGKEMMALGARMAEKGIVPGGGDAQSRKMMADLQRQMTKVNGMPVLQITRMKAADDAKAKQMQEQMAAARAQMEALKKAGGKQAEMAEKLLATMGGAGGKYLMEITSESSAFSAAAIGAAEFTVPAGYKKADR
jgi:hypothetical protein